MPVSKVLQEILVYRGPLVTLANKERPERKVILVQREVLEAPEAPPMFMSSNFEFAGLLGADVLA
jgi:hypothetical protein